MSDQNELIIKLRGRLNSLSDFIIQQKLCARPYAIRPRIFRIQRNPQLQYSLGAYIEELFQDLDKLEVQTLPPIAAQEIATQCLRKINILTYSLGKQCVNRVELNSFSSFLRDAQSSGKSVLDYMVTQKERKYR